ncbi:hypothetical protein F4780DRAFT_779711 [Xylariomycetidae sp. FL0641]|nr:hypothetical protein F4780DRAFT_779711 [Xylariomycetidae sp. FL0641]
MERPSSPRHRPAPYGHSCTNCAKAKCKCLTAGPPGSPCERCTRLGKDCRPSASVRRRQAAARRSSGGGPRTGDAAAAAIASERGGGNADPAHRTAQLEERLEDLVNLLKAQAEAGGGGGRNAAAAAGCESVDAPPCSHDPRTGAWTGRHLHMPPCMPTPAGSVANSSTSASTPGRMVAAPDVALSQAEAEETLRLFRECHLSYMPFMYIPPDVGVEELEREKPYTWLNIRAICCKSASQQAVLATRCREIFAKKVYVDMERSMDLLLGLLAYHSWVMFHLCGKPFLMVSTNMIMTLISDLRLDKSILDKEMTCYKSYTAFPRACCPANPSHETRRAALAAYIQCSAIAGLLHSNTLRWTTSLEDALAKLEAEPEWSGDEHLVTMARIVQVMEDVARVTWRAKEEGDSPNPAARPPVDIYVRSLRGNLQALRDGLPAAQRADRTISSYLLAAEVAVNDMPFWNHNPFHQNPWTMSGPSSATTATRRCSNNHATATNGEGGGGDAVDPGTNDIKTAVTRPRQPRRPVVNLARLEAYYAVLASSKACVANFVDGFAAREYVGLTFSLLLHFFRGLQILYRLLLTADDPDWDREVAARDEQLDMMNAVETVAARFDAVARLHGLEEPDAKGCAPGGGAACGADRHPQFFSKSAHSLRATVPMWTASLGSLSAAETRGGEAVRQDHSAPGAGAVDMPPMAPEDPMLAGAGPFSFDLHDIMTMDFSGEAWWSDPLGGGGSSSSTWEI